MDLDFKDRTFSFLKLKKKKLRRRVFFISSLILILILFLFIRDRGALRDVRQAEELILSGNFEECSEFLTDTGSHLFRRSSFHELKGILQLIGGDRESGEILLKKGSPGRSSVRTGKMMAYLSDNCFYIALDSYTSLLPGNDDEVSFYRIVSDTSLYRAEESGKKIGGFSPGDPEKYAVFLSVLRRFNKKTKSGRIDFVFDRDGEPLASFDPGSGKCTSLVPGIFFGHFEDDLTKGQKYVKLSIDRDIQMTVHRSFRNYSGSFILTDLEDGSIVACYSKPYNGDEKNSVLTDEYEPGSIIKLITMFSYLNSTGEQVFPFECNGFTAYNGKIFYDWMKHGTLHSPEQALSRSCNIAFAEMGIISGMDRIKDTLEHFLFNGNPAADGVFQFRFGTFTPELTGRRDLANLSIGLEHISVTTVHSAIISAIIAQNGNIIFPYLIMSKQNIFGLGHYSHTPGYRRIFINNKYFEDIKTGMREVASDPEGTGKRAAVSFMEIGLKTGTAGSKDEGFDSVLTGFFPFEKPRYAFAFRLEHGGKAEYNGALFLRSFLKSFHGKQ